MPRERPWPAPDELPGTEVCVRVRRWPGDARRPIWTVGSGGPVVTVATRQPSAIRWIGCCETGTGGSTSRPDR